jgi:hypothetical protein
MPEGPEHVPSTRTLGAVSKPGCGDASTIVGSVVVGVRGAGGDDEDVEDDEGEAVDAVDDEDVDVNGDEGGGLGTVALGGGGGALGLGGGALGRGGGALDAGGGALGAGGGAVLGTDGALDAGAAIAEALDDGALATDGALAVVATGLADEPLPHPAAKARTVTGITNARRGSRTKSTEPPLGSSERGQTPGRARSARDARFAFVSPCGVVRARFSPRNVHPGSDDRLATMPFAR